MTIELSRRTLLRTSLASACSVAAHPLVSPVVFAATPGDQRLVVIVLRGAMDGLGVIQPYGDPLYAAMRPSLGRTPDRGLYDLDGYFGLHAGLGRLMPLWQKGELAVVHAVSTPYRSKRSHFDGQDFLENGGNSVDGEMTDDRDGWLNRALGFIPNTHSRTAMAVGQDHMILLDGNQPAGSWSPATELTLADDERRLLRMIYADDPLFAKTFDDAAQISEGAGEGDRRETHKNIAEFTARQLNGESRIAAFSINGWDTHRHQEGVLKRSLKQLTDSILALREGLGRYWGKTTVIAVTEFGRTARENGTLGTDHGTAGAMILAGGTLKGGRVMGRWPGIGESDLYENRDLLPTEDLRRYCGWLLAQQYGISVSDIERTVFPGVDMGSDPGILA